MMATTQAISKYLTQTFPLFKLFFYIALMYLFGIVKGIVLSLIIHKTYLLIMFKVLRLEPFSSGDKTFVFRPITERYNFIGYIIFNDDFNIEALKESIIERGIKQYRKLRSVNCYKFFEFWWKELPIEQCINDLAPFEVRNNIGKFESTQDLINYSYNEIELSFNLFTQLPYKFIFVKNDNGTFKNFIILKVDHCLSDGLGFVGLLTALGENYDLKLFPQSMKKKTISCKEIIISLLFSPYYACYAFYRNLFQLSTRNTPFKSSRPISGFPKAAISSPYDFDQYSKINKKLGITFNDMMMNAFSAAISKYCSIHCKETPKRISSYIPISNRALPKDPKNLQITNDSSAVGCEIILINDPIKQCKIISKEFAKNARNIYMYKTTKFVTDFMNDYLPYYLTKFIFGSSARLIDIVFTNVALPKEDLIYAGYPVKAFYPIMTPGMTYAFIGIYSYSGKFHVSICLDNVLEMNPNEFLELFNEQMDYFLLVNTTSDDKISNSLFSIKNKTD